MKKETGSAVNSIAVLMICNLLSRLLGFGRDMVMSYKYGTSSVSDVYYIATNIVTVIFFAISAAISTTYLPIYAKADSESETKSKDFHNTLFTIALSVSIVFSAIIFAFGRQITWIFASSFETEQFDLTVKFIQIMSLSMFFNCLSQLIGSFLQFRNKFFFAGITGSVLNIGYIIGAVLADLYGPMMLAYSFLLVHIFVAIMLIVYSKKYTFSLSLTLHDKGGYMGQAWTLIIPIIFGNIAGQFSEAIDKSMASGLDTGSVSSLNYANKLQTFSIGVFVASIVTVSFPKLSKEYANKNMNKAKNQVRDTTISILAISLPIMFGLIILSTDLVSLVFKRGEFNTHSVMLTSGALVIYAIGLPATALREMLIRSLYAMEDTKNPIIIDILGLGANIALNFLFINQLKHLGLALGTSLANIIKACLLMYLVCKKLKDFFNKKFIIECLKIIFSSTVMAVVVYLSNNALGKILYTGTFQLLITFFASVLIGILVYAFILYLVKSELFLKMVDIATSSLNKIFKGYPHYQKKHEDI